MADHRVAGPTLERAAPAVPWAELIAHPRQDAEQSPWRVSVRDLSQRLSKIFSRVHEERCPAVVTYRGVPTWVVLPLDQSRLASFLLSNMDELTGEIIRSPDAEDEEELLAHGKLRTLQQFEKDQSSP